MCRFIVCIVYIHRYTSFLTEAALTKAESTKAGSSRKRRLFGANFQICFMTWWWQKDLFSFFSRIYMARWCISWRVVLFRVIHITLFSRFSLYWPNPPIFFVGPLIPFGIRSQNCVFWYCLPPNPLSTMHSSIWEFFFVYPCHEPAWIMPAPQCRANRRWSIQK
jgi:hypothetical protein